MYKYRIACSGFNYQGPTLQNGSILRTTAVPMKTSTRTDAYTWILLIMGSYTRLEERIFELYCAATAGGGLGGRRFL